MDRFRGMLVAAAPEHEHQQCSPVWFIDAAYPAQRERSEWNARPIGLERVNLHEVCQPHRKYPGLRSKQRRWKLPLHGHHPSCEMPG